MLANMEKEREREKNIRRKKQVDIVNEEINTRCVRKNFRD